MKLFSVIWIIIKVREFGVYNLICFLQDARREEMLVNRLMRQSQQERRIAVQLLQARHEKEVIRKNRTMREKQYEERRLKEFQEALNREAVSVKELYSISLKSCLLFHFNYLCYLYN